MSKSDLIDCLTKGETLLYSASGEGDMGLTNKRIIVLNGPASEFKDIRYPHIASIEWGAYDNIWYIVIGAIAALFGWALTGQSGDLASMGIFFIIAGIVLVALYFFTKKSGLIIVTEQEKIAYSFKGRESHDMVKEISKIVREHDKP
ncbi:MAG: hypothetical protein IB616_03005 [Methanosarcinales archaeon]|nr:MAG: hypothetical protein IB616_03005 [Methanosarcinales archaeon]